MDEEIRQALSEVREMKQMCGYINMKLTNIVTQRGQDWKKKLEAEYHRGLSEGNDIGYKDGVKDGQNEAWECAKKLFSPMADFDIEKAFPIEWNNGGFNALMNLQPQEAIEKLKAYEEKQKADDEIKVGDEVKPSYSDITGMVTLIDDDTIYVLWRDGSSTGILKLKEVTKTGRHFDIASILKEMQS